MTALLPAIALALSMEPMQTTTPTPCVRIPHQQSVTVEIGILPGPMPVTGILQVPGPGVVLEIEYISMLMTAANGQHQQVYATSVSTQLFGNRAEHSIGPVQSQLNSTLAPTPIAPMIAFNNEPAMFGQPVKLYADAQSDIHFTTALRVSDPSRTAGRITWTISGRLLVGACAIL